MGIKVITGVPDSTLKQFCDGLQTYNGGLKHYVPANEGAAVGIAAGTYLATGKPACVYLQNSGIGNTINPLASIANKDVYGIPMLLIVGWRGEPGVKDEPQHVFQGKITCELFDTMNISYSVIDSETTWEKMLDILDAAQECFGKNEQYAIIVKKGTFEPAEKYVWKNTNTLNREHTLGTLLKIIPRDACIVSTTGKISRELYEQSNMIYGNHDSIFMTVGGMGHASMIAFGIAQSDPERRVICIDGDGAALMHMGALAFIAANAPANYVHIVINNQAHESVGSMPTGCQNVSFAAIAETAGYKKTFRISTEEELSKTAGIIENAEGPVLIEIMVALDSRADLGRPAETAAENRDSFMSYLKR
jgi:phosphonopyruvate decarboxylase